MIRKNSNFIFRAHEFGIIFSWQGGQGSEITWKVVRVIFYTLNTMNYISLARQFGRPGPTSRLRSLKKKKSNLVVS